MWHQDNNMHKITNLRNYWSSKLREIMEEKTPLLQNLCAFRSLEFKAPAFILFSNWYFCYYHRAVTRKAMSIHYTPFVRIRLLSGFFFAALELYNTSIYHYCLMQHKKPVFLCIHLFQESSQKKPHTDFIMRHSTITLHVFSNPVDHYSGLCVINYQPMI